MPYDFVDKEVDRLVARTCPISDWALPIVPVLKVDKLSFRVYGDFRQTISKHDRYPIPKMKDLFVR